MTISIGLVAAVLHDVRALPRTALPRERLLRILRLSAMLAVGFGALGLVQVAAGFGGPPEPVRTLRFGVVLGVPVWGEVTVDGPPPLLGPSQALFFWGAVMALLCTVFLGARTVRTISLQPYVDRVLGRDTRGSRSAGA